MASKIRQMASHLCDGDYNSDDSMDAADTNFAGERDSFELTCVALLDILMSNCRMHSQSDGPILAI